MAISIKGVNTGVIRKSNNFIALALKIKEPRKNRWNRKREVTIQRTGEGC